MRELIGVRGPFSIYQIAAITDLIEAIEKDCDTKCGARDCTATPAAVFESHRLSTPVDLPLNLLPEGGFMSGKILKNELIKASVFEERSSRMRSNRDSATSSRPACSPS